MIEDRHVSVQHTAVNRKYRPECTAEACPLSIAKKYASLRQITAAFGQSYLLIAINSSHDLCPCNWCLHHGHTTLPLSFASYNG